MSIELEHSAVNNTVPRANPWRMMPAEIVGIDVETPEVRTYHVALANDRDAAAYRILPGQFNMLYVPGVGESAISVSGDPRHCHPLIHTVHSVGNVTGSLARLKVGDTLGVRGPFGSSWPLQRCHAGDLILVAGGIGLAPLRSVVDHVIANRDSFGHVWLLVGAKSPAALVYAPQYDRWRRQGIDVRTTVDRPSDDWSGNVGVVTPLLNQLLLPQPESTRLLTCGPEIMMRFVARAAIQRGLKPEQVWVTLERNMRCAFGHCGHCQLGPHFICKDGPVFRYDRVADLLEVDSL